MMYSDIRHILSGHGSARDGSGHGVGYGCGYHYYGDGSAICTRRAQIDSTKSIVYDDYSGGASGRGSGIGHGSYRNRGHLLASNANGMVYKFEGRWLSNPIEIIVEHFHD
jgi:hypothetical protein